MGDHEDKSLSWRRTEEANPNEEGATAENDGIPHEIRNALNAIDEEPRRFITYFRMRFKEGATEEMHSLYEDSFVKLSERYYKNSAWPSAAAVAYLVDQDELFLLLYKELTYRHLYARGHLSLTERIEAWENYCELFNRFLENDMIEYDLPASWIWDMIDEFIYQFEVWCQYRSRLKDKTPEEIAMLRANDSVWTVNSVLQYLHALVTKSAICPWLLNDNTPVGSADPNGENLDLSNFAVYRYIGYFSIVGLLRIYCILGDYRLGLMVLQSLDFNPQTALFTHVTACHISVYYFMGFAYLMLRKYEDAGRVFGTTLLHIGRIKQSHIRSYQYEQVNKRIDQMLALLSICITFHPQYVDESTMSLLKDKYADKIARMRVGEEAAFMELFKNASPKFIAPAPPNYDVIGDYNMEAAELQQKRFMAEIRQQLLLPEIRSYLKMYTTIELSKLAQLMETDVETFRSHLLSLKHKSFTARSDSIGVRSGLVQGADAPVNSDIGFYIDGDVVHVADTKVESRHGEFFIKQIDKLNDLTNFASRLQKPIPSRKP